MNLQKVNSFGILLLGTEGPRELWKKVKKLEFYARTTREDLRPSFLLDGLRAALLALDLPSSADRGCPRSPSPRITTPPARALPPSPAAPGATHSPLYALPGKVAAPCTVCCVMQAEAGWMEGACAGSCTHRCSCSASAGASRIQQKLTAVGDESQSVGCRQAAEMHHCATAAQGLG